MGAGWQRWWREPLDTNEALQREYQRLATYMAEDRPDWWDHWLPVRNDDPVSFAVSFEHPRFNRRVLLN